MFLFQGMKLNLCFVSILTVLNWDASLSKIDKDKDT